MRKQISGSLSWLIKRVENIDLLREQIIGTPIKDERGNEIGVIDSVDNDNWYGYISERFLNNIKETESIEIVLKEDYNEEIFKTKGIKLLCVYYTLIIHL